MSDEGTVSVEGFGQKQVCSIVGITYRQLDYWARTDLLRPSIADAKGSGSQRRYSYQDVLELKVIKSLLDGGVSLQAVRKVIEYLRTNMGEDLASANLVLDGKSLVLCRTDEEIIDLLKSGQGVLNIVPVAGLKGEVDAKVLELFPPAADAGATTGTGRASHEAAI